MAAVPRDVSFADRLSNLFWRRPAALLFVLLVPPLAWLGVVYLGSLSTLLLHSFFFHR